MLGNIAKIHVRIIRITIRIIRNKNNKNKNKKKTYKNKTARIAQLLAGRQTRKRMEGQFIQKIKKWKQSFVTKYQSK